MLSSPKEWAELAGNIASEAELWCKFAVADEEATSSTTPTVSSAQQRDEALARLQEAYDECTRTCTSIRSASKRLLSIVDATSLSANQTRTCVIKARQMEPHLMKFESVLFETEKAVVDAVHVRQILKDAAQPNSDLWKSEQELVRLTINAERDNKKRMLSN